MHRIVRGTLAAAAALAFAGASPWSSSPAFAHHGWSDYETDHPLTLKGRITASRYENPHATITLDAGGKTYEVVLAPVSRMEARGAAREAVAVGQDVTVVAYASRTHAGEVRAERILFADGAATRTVELR